MSMQDPVADMLTRIRNAQAMGIKKIDVAYSNLKSDILTVLKDEGYIDDFFVTQTGVKKDISVNLKYFQGAAVIEKIQRISKPSLRQYRGYNDLPQVRGGLGIAIISTPKGVMSDKSARSAKVGGEVLCIVE